MVNSLNKILERVRPSLNRGVIKTPEFIKIKDQKISWIKINQFILDLRLCGFDSEQAQIADKIENIARNYGLESNSLKLKIFSSLLESSCLNADNARIFETVEVLIKNGLKDNHFWDLVLIDNCNNFLAKLLFADQFGNVFDFFNDLGLDFSLLDTDLSIFLDELGKLNPSFENSLIDHGLYREWNYQYDRDGIQFIRNTPRLRVLNKMGFYEFLRKTKAKNIEKKRYVAVVDISGMSAANQAISNDGKIVYGDPYMAEFVGVTQVILNLVLPNLGLKCILARLGGDEFIIHIEANAELDVNFEQLQFVSNLLNFIVSKIQIIQANEFGIVGISNARFKDSKAPEFTLLDYTVYNLMTDLFSIPDSLFLKIPLVEQQNVIRKIAELKEKIRGLLQGGNSEHKIGEIISQANQMEITNLDPHSGINSLVYKDGLSDIVFLHFAQVSHYLCLRYVWLEPFGMKEQNDKFGDVYGDKYKADFEYSVYLLLKDITPELLSKLLIFKNGPKFIIGLKKDISLDLLPDLTSEFDLLIEGIKQLKTILPDSLEKFGNCTSESNEIKIPVICSSVSIRKPISTKEILDHLDQSAVVYWMEKIILESQFLKNIWILEYLNSVKKGVYRVRDLVAAMQSLSLNSTIALSNIIDFFDKICLEDSTQPFCDDINHYKKLFSEEILNDSELDLIAVINAILLYNREAGLSEGFTDETISEFVNMMTQEGNKTLIINIYTRVLKCFVDNQTESDKVRVYLFELIRDISKILKKEKDYIHDELQFDGLIQAFCDILYDTLLYLKSILTSIKESKNKLNNFDFAQNVDLV